MRASEDDAEDDVGALLAADESGRRARTPTLRVEQFGDASAGKALGKMFEDDFKKAEILSIPVTLLILLVAFGALVAAGLPLLLALSSVMATLGLVSLGSHLIAVEDSVSSVVLLIGLAVGVDYSLFYLRREREERAAGPVRGGRAAGRRRDLGPRGADLGPDRDDRDGRHVHHRRLDLHGHGDGRDPRRRRLADRVADGPPRAPQQARRQGRPRPHPVPDAQARRLQAAADLGRRDRRRAAPPARLRAGLRRPPARALPPGAGDEDRAAGDRDAAALAAGDADLRPHPVGLPRPADRGRHGRLGRRRPQHAAGAGRAREIPQSGAGERHDPRADHDRAVEIGRRRENRPADRRRRHQRRLARARSTSCAASWRLPCGPSWAEAPTRP